MKKDQSEPFKKFIEEIASLVIKTRDKAEALTKSAMSIYKEGWRHNYSVVTAIKISKDPNNSLNDLTNILNNIDIIIGIVEESTDPKMNKPKELVAEAENCLSGLIRLKDHVSLELIRLGYINRIKENFDKFNIDTNEVISKYKEIKRVLITQKNEAITILGIFASIVTVFAAGIGISSAIFSNMNDIGTWRLYSLTCLIVLFITNILALLFDFLRDIAEKPKTKHDHIWALNIVLIIVSVCCFLVSFSDEIPQSQNRLTSSVSCSITNNSESISKP